MSTFLQKATLEEIRNAAARICRDYLTGRWKVVAPEHLIVKRISGGLSNFLYYVSLPANDDIDEECIKSTGNTAISLNNKQSTQITAAYDKNSNDSCEGNSDDESNGNIYSNAQHAMKRQPQSQQQQNDAKNFEIGVTGAEMSNNKTNYDDIERKTFKRQRIDSDSNDSNSLKRTQLGLNQEPHEVLLRIYGQTHGVDALENMITESVIFALLSERNFGPKLHGIFPGGRIEQYIPARSLTTRELSDPRISMKIAEKMGEIHSLNIPMSKEPDWIWNCMNRWLKSLDNIVNDAIESEPDSTAILQKQRELLSTIDFVEEMNWLKSIVDAGNYPVTFCHNDLQEGNILMRQQTDDAATPKRQLKNSESSAYDETLGDSLDGDGNDNLDDVHANKNTNKISSLSPVLLDTADDSALDASFTSDNEPDLIIIDFEYCAYNYRGFDLANHFVEWIFDYTIPEYPYFHQNNNHCATMQQRRDFIITYLKKYYDYACNDADDTSSEYISNEQEIAAIQNEIQLFSMLSHLFWSLWSVVNVTSTIEFGYWDYAVARILEYRKLKSAYIEEMEK